MLATPVEPRELDPIIRAAVDGALDALRIWKELRPICASFISDFRTIVEKQRVYLNTEYRLTDHKLFVTEAHATMAAMTNQLDKTARAAVSLAKAVSELARLGVFLDGGEEAADLGDMSVAELGRLVLNVASTLEGKKGV